MTRVVFYGLSVGKTSLINQIYNSKAFNDDIENTLSIDLTEHEGMTIVDPACHIVVNEKIPICKDAEIVCLCFDAHDRDSYEHLQRNINKIQEQVADVCYFFLVETKADLQTPCVVSADEIEAFVEDYQISTFIQTSSKNNINLKSLETTIDEAQAYLAQNQEEEYEDDEETEEQHFTFQFDASFVVTVLAVCATISAIALLIAALVTLSTALGIAAAGAVVVSGLLFASKNTFFNQCIDSPDESETFSFKHAYS